MLKTRPDHIAKERCHQDSESRCTHSGLLLLTTGIEWAEFKSRRCHWLCSQPGETLFIQVIRCVFNSSVQICHVDPLCLMPQSHTKNYLCPVSKPPLPTHRSPSTLCDICFFHDTQTSLFDCYPLLIDWLIHFL